MESEAYFEAEYQRLPGRNPCSPDLKATFVKTVSPRKKNAHQLKWARASGAVNQWLTAPEQAQRETNFIKKGAGSVKDAGLIQKTRRTLIINIS